jgi:hypothetical protein
VELQLDGSRVVAEEIQMVADVLVVKVEGVQAVGPVLTVQQVQLILAVAVAALEVKIIPQVGEDQA